MNLLKQLLTESDTSADAAASQLIAAVKGAQSFFEGRGDTTRVMFRGLRSPRGLVATMHSRTRRPLDSSQLVHNALDENLARDFGFAYRSQGTFVTPGQKQAELYGPAHVVLPQGEWEFCWSPVVHDGFQFFGLNRFVTYCERQPLSEEADQLLRDEIRWMEEDRDIAAVVAKNDEFLALFNKWFDGKYKEARFRNSDLAAAMATNNEIILKCDSYVIVPQYARFNELVESINVILGTDISPNITGDVLVNTIAQRVL